MKAFILAAGNGTRLRPLTDDNPKCLLPIQGTPLLGLWLENCEIAGIGEVLINVHAHAEKVQDFIAGYQGPVRIQLAKEDELLGSAGTLHQNRAFVAGEAEFLILYGDVLTNTSLAEMISFHRRTKMPATLGVVRVRDPERCGVVSFDHERVVRNFVEKPANPNSNWAFSGIMVARPEIVDLAPSDRPADIGFHLLPRLVGRVAAYPISDFLMDIGTIENYTAAQSLWLGFNRVCKTESACCGE